MLTHLTLKNFVLIDELDLDMRPGLCVITGETGAGKSIMLTALGLVTGARVQPGLIGKSSDRAEVSAAFDLPKTHAGQRILAAQDIDPGGELILRRTINSDGRTKAFINGQQVPVSILHEIGTHLIEIQGQFDQLAILSPRNHRALMDETLGLGDQLADLRGKYEVREARKNALETETARLEKLQEDQEYLQHCLQELDETNIQDGEIAALNDRRALLRQLSDAGEALGQLSKVLNGDRGLIDQLAKATKLASRLPGQLANEMADMITNLDQAWNAGESAAADLSHKLQDLDGAEQDLEDTSQRLFHLKDLARKHECQSEDLIDKREEIRQTLATLDQGQAHLRALAEAFAQAQQAYFQAAQTLSLARKQGGATLSNAINGELPALRLPEARVHFDIGGEPDMMAGPAGYDQVRLYAQTNRGGASGPLEKTASGGELSRILLALKLALAPKSGPSPLMVFDEADAGVGGATAAALGTRLRRLGDRGQVLAVTHSPQLAAAGNWHLKVTKETRADRTGSRIDPLDAAARTQEIARMLAGSQIGAEAMEAAKTLQREFTE